MSTYSSYRLLWDLSLTITVLLSICLSAWLYVFHGEATVIVGVIDFAMGSLLIADLFLKPKQKWTGFLALAALPWLAILHSLSPEDVNWSFILPAFRLFFIPEMWSRYHSHRAIFSLPMWYKTPALVFICATVIHMVSCAWIAVSENYHSDVATTYNMALYWTITTLTTIGYGDITPQTNVSRLFTMGIMISGVGVYGIVIGQFSNFILARNRRKEHARDKINKLMELMSDYNVPKETQMEVYNFYNHLIHQKVQEDEHSILRELPASLENELLVYMNMKPLSEVGLFSEVSQECLKEAARYLSQLYIEPGEKIIRVNDPAEEMYLIGPGRMKIEVDGQIIAVLSEGQVVGEMALVEGGTRGADVTALSYCDVFRLDKADFDSLVSRHSDLRKKVDSLVSERKSVA